MNETLAAIYIIAGLVLLVGGGEILVRGSTSLAAVFRIPKLVIGLVLVAFGTSAPELAVSVMAAAKGSTEIALSNVIGSNIANIAVALALTVLIFPVTVAPELLRREAPAILAFHILCFPLVFNGTIGRFEGFLLLAMGAGYMIWLFRDAARDRERARQEGGEAEGGNASLSVAILYSIGGLAALIYGSSLVVDGAVEIAHRFGVSERVIGLTLVAFGTSLPEIATCIVAAYRKESDLVLANLLGSCIFNGFIVLGAAAAIMPLPISPEEMAGTWFDLGAALIMFVAVFIAMAARKKTGRFEGVLLGLFYAVYLFFLFKR